MQRVGKLKENSRECLHMFYASATHPLRADSKIASR